MQSAFVDLGLERDTFLYVSDFFEENEEYDRISTEDRGRERGDRGRGRGDREPGERNRGERDREREAEPVVVAPIIIDTPEVAAAPPAVEVPAAAEPVESAAAPQQRGEERDFGDRRGRRSRRRRNRGRGFPDSKYASDVNSTEPKAKPKPAPVVAEAVAPVAESADDFLVLPGESLAKYTRPSMRKRN